MSSSEISNLIRAYIDAVNSHNIAKVESILTDDFKWSSPAGQRTGRGETSKYMTNWFTAFPDLKLEFVSGFGEGNSVAVECRLTGTHRGNFVSDFGQFAPTNKRISVDMSNLCKVQNGKISEIHAFYDSAVLLSQLGIHIEKRAA
jgi:steroid delta-isomerase-like uncharacterized protein